MIDPDSLVKIKAFIERIVQPNEEEWKAFEEILQTKKLKRKELLLKEGQVCTFIAFLNAGVLREYSYQHDKEITVDFVGENHIIKLEDYFGLPSDDNYLNMGLGKSNEMFSRLLDIEDSCQ